MLGRLQVRVRLQIPSFQIYIVLRPEVYQHAQVTCAVFGQCVSRYMRYILGVFRNRHFVKIGMPQPHEQNSIKKLK